MRRVAVLRPEPGASTTLARAREQGLDAFKLPLFAIERRDWTPPPDLSLFDGLLVTSANAFREGGDGLETLKGLPVYAVGPATAEAGRAAGFAIAETGVANVRFLLRSLDPALRLLHLAGEDRIDTRRFWQTITSLPVYRARAIEDIDGRRLAGCVALVHSPRAGRRLAEVASDKPSIAIAALSKAAAQACGAGWERIEAVRRPSDVALLALAARLCDKPEG